MEGKTSELEALLSEGDADKGNAENDTNEIVNKREDRTEGRPHDVCKRVSLEAGINHFTKWPASESGDLEALNAKWNAYEGNAESDTENEPYYRHNKATGDTPENVSECFHLKAPLIL